MRQLLAVLIYLHVCDKLLTRQHLSVHRHDDLPLIILMKYIYKHTLTGGEARCEVEELLHELAEAELGKQVTVTGVAVKIHTDT